MKVTFNTVKSNSNSISVNDLVFGVVSPILNTKFCVISFRVTHGHPGGFDSFFGNFGGFLPLFLASLISNVLVTLNLITLVLPKVCLTISCVFTPLFIVSGGVRF